MKTLSLFLLCVLSVGCAFGQTLNSISGTTNLSSVTVTMPHNTVTITCEQYQPVYKNCKMESGKNLDDLLNALADQEKSKDAEINEAYGQLEKLLVSLNKLDADYKKTKKACRK